MRIGVSLIRDTPWMGLCAGLFAAAPIVTLGNYFRELVFAWYWGQRNRPVEPAGLSEVAL